MSLVCTHARRRTIDIEHILYILVGEQEFHSPVGYLAGSLYRRTLRQFEFKGKIALVFGRHKTCRHQAVAHKYYNQCHTERCKHSARMCQRPSDHAAIEMIASHKPVVDKSEEFAFTLLALWLEQHRTHNRRQGKCNNGRYYHTHCNRDCKLTVQLTGNTGQEAYRHKHRTEHKRHRYKGAAKALHSPACSLGWVYMLSLHDTIYVLYYHNSIVNYDTDCKNKAEQRQHIERESEYQHHTECTNK